MALRSLGSTLLAKTGTGSALRSADETRKQGAVQQQASSAQPESVIRKTTEQPLEKAVPEGTDKLLAVQPNIQGKVSLDTTSGSPSAPNSAMGMLPGNVGQPAPSRMNTRMGMLPTAQAAATPRTGQIDSAAASTGTAARAAESGMVTGAPTGFNAPSAQTAATPRSGGVNLGKQLAQAFGGWLAPEEITAYAKSGSERGTPTQVKNEAPTWQSSGVNPAFGWLTGVGNRVSAAGEQAGQNVQQFNRNLIQGIANTLGGAIDSGGKFFQNVAPEMNVSENMQSFASRPSGTGIMQNLQAAAEGRPMPVLNTPSAQNVSNALRSVSSNVSKTAQNTGNALRSQAQSTASKVSNAVNQAKSTASNVANSVKQAASNVVSKASNALRSLFKR